MLGGDDYAVEVDNIGDYPVTDFAGGDRLVKVSLSQLKTYMVDPLLFLTAKVKTIEPHVIEGEEVNLLVSKCHKCHKRFRWAGIPADSLLPPCPQKWCGGTARKKPSFVLKLTFVHGNGVSQALLLKEDANYFLGCTVYDFIKHQAIRDRVRRALDFLVTSDRTFRFCVRLISFEDPFSYIVQSTKLISAIRSNE